MLGGLQNRGTNSSRANARHIARHVVSSVFGDDRQLITVHERPVPDQRASSLGEIVCKSFVKEDNEECGDTSQQHGTNRIG